MPKGTPRATPRIELRGYPFPCSSSSGGAFGVFEATDDISDICKAKVFKRGTKTRVLSRFSTVGMFSAIVIHSDEELKSMLLFRFQRVKVVQLIQYEILVASQSRCTPMKVRVHTCRLSSIHTCISFRSLGYGWQQYTDLFCS